MTRCIFATDLHGSLRRYEKLFDVIAAERPQAVFLGGDLFPHFGRVLGDEFAKGDFLQDFLGDGFRRLRDALKDDYPEIFAILGNDDPRYLEEEFDALGAEGLFHYMHARRKELAGYPVYGYANCPPSPFLNKDWELYDVSQHVDPGCVSPEEGNRAVPVLPESIKYGTIKDELDRLIDGRDMDRAVMLFHSPPYKTKLDRAALDGKMIDHVPLDVHVGSIAIQRLIEAWQPLVTMHGHIHESTRMTGEWRDKIGCTHMFNAAHDGTELAVIKFDLENLDAAVRQIL